MIWYSPWVKSLQAQFFCQLLMLSIAYMEEWKCSFRQLKRPLGVFINFVHGFSVFTDSCNYGHDVAWSHKNNMPICMLLCCHSSLMMNGQVTFCQGSMSAGILSQQMSHDWQKKKQWIPVPLQVWLKSNIKLSKTSACKSLVRICSTHILTLISHCSFFSNSFCIHVLPTWLSWYIPDSKKYQSGEIQL